MVVVALAERGDELRREGMVGDDGGEFEQFFDGIWPRAVRMAVRMGLSREDAEDVVVDALAVTYDRWARVSVLAHREGWVLKVAANRALRQLKRRAHSSAEPDDEAVFFDEEVTVRLAVRQGIRRLPRRQREVVALRYLADMSEEQVSETLGMSVGTVKQHASRGRERLRLDLSAPEGGDVHVS